MAEEKKCDVAVIGSGPGGYVAAIKAAQAGRKVILIEKGVLGGTCLNCGCIPTKTLLAGSDVYRSIKHASEYGIDVGDVKIDYKKMKERKDDVIKGIRQGLEGLIKSNKIEVVYAEASFMSKNQLKLKGDFNGVVNADKIIIASGSKPMDIPQLPCDHKQVLNSTSILEMETLPKSIAIVGGGYIGCEFASLYAELGCKVTIIEAMDRIVQTQGDTVSLALTEAFQKKGIDILNNEFVDHIDQSPNGITAVLKSGKNVEAEVALISIGRSVVSQELGLEKAYVSVTDRGVIEVDSQMRTNIEGIYAIGDVTAKAMLAHVASHQGIVAASNAVGHQAFMHYHAVPAVIFTNPEIATVGYTIEKAKEDGYPAISKKFPLQILGKAQASLHTEGFTEVVIDSQTRQILGAQVVGHGAADLIAEMALGIQNELTIDCIMDTIHAHPTMAEAWLETAFMVNETPVHYPPR